MPKHLLPWYSELPGEDNDVTFEQFLSEPAVAERSDVRDRRYEGLNELRARCSDGRRDELEFVRLELAERLSRALDRFHTAMEDWARSGSEPRPEAVALAKEDLADAIELAAAFLGGQMEIHVLDGELR